MRRSAGSVLLLALLVASPPPPASAQHATEATPHQASPIPVPDLESVPAPVIDAFEPEARRQLEEARAATARLIAERQPEAGEAFATLCLLYLRHELLDAAEPCLAQARALAPRDFRWPYYQAFLYTRRGDLERARSSVEAALALQPAHVPALVRAGDLHLLAGDPARAEPSFTAALAADPGSSAARFGLGRVAAQRGRHAAAVAHFEAALEGQPEGSILHHHLGMAYRAQGDLERARRELGRNRQVEVAGSDPLIERLQALGTSREAIFQYGIERLRAGDAQAALAAFRRVVELDPTDAQAHYNVARAQLELGALEEAERHLRRALELWPGFFDAHVNLAILLGRTRRSGEAAEHVEAAVAIDPEHLPTRVLWARVLAGRGATAEAIAALEAVLEIDASATDARLALAALTARSGDLPQARRQLEQIVASGAAGETARAEAHLRLARLEGTASDRIEHHLRAALELDPRSVEAHGLLAEQLARRGSTAAAAEEMARVVELAPDDPRARIGLSTLLILAGEHRRAREGLESALRRLPESAPLQQLLARFLATCPEPELRDGERAIALAERLVERELTIEHVETLAMALAETGRFDDAIRWQERALERRAAAGATSPASVRWLESYRRGQPVREPWRESAAAGSASHERSPR